MDISEFKGETFRIASFASKIKFIDLPCEIVNHAKLCILDIIGCGLFGSTLPWGKLMARFVKGQGGLAEAVVWGHGVKVPWPGSACRCVNTDRCFKPDHSQFAGREVGKWLVTLLKVLQNSQPT